MVDELLAPVIDFSLNLISTAGYPGIVAVTILENVFPPIPSEIVMPFAGFLVTQGRLALIPSIASGVLGSVLGALILYAIGAIFRGPRLRKFIDRYGRYALISNGDLDLAENYFQRYGFWSIIIARVIPVVRSIISIPAGFVRFGLIKFVILTTLGTLAWTTLLTYSGLLLGANWRYVGPFLKKYEDAVLVLIGGLILYFLYRRLRPKQQSS